MPRTRTIIVVISILSCCALMCVGFSAWSIVTNETFSAISNGAITSEEVIVSDEYVWVDEYNSFIITKFGFKSGSTTSYTGTIDVTFGVNKDKCAELGGGAPLKIRAVLSLQNNAAMQNVFSKVQFQCTESGVVVSTSISEENSVTATFTLDATQIAGDSFSGTFTFNLDKTTFATLYNNLVAEGQSEVTNPFSIVVMVSNETAPAGAAA